MPKMVYDEWYGDLTYAQRAAYRKFNVTPAIHDDLVEEFGADNHEAITRAVKQRSEQHGYYLMPMARIW